MPHFIRLRGPWNCQPVGRWKQNLLDECRIATDDLPQGGAVTLPGDWSSILGEDYLGSVQFTRSFRCPQTVAAANQVWLEIEDVEWRAKVELNNQPLGEIVGSRASIEELDQRCPVRFDITRLLRPSNLLSVTVTSQPPGTVGARSGQLGLVRLEIE